MGVIWRKAWRDLAHNRLRTALVVLSIAVGVFALGLIFGAKEVIRDCMTEDHRATQPAHVVFWGGPFDQDVVDTVLQEPGVADADGRIQASIRWKLEGDVDWRDGDVVARADYDAQHMELVDLLEGHWPEDRVLAIERQSSRHFGIAPGTEIILEVGQRERRLPIEGIVRVADVYPPQMGGNGTFYASPEAMAWLSGQDDFNMLGVRLESFSQEAAEEAGETIKDRLERMGLSVSPPYVEDPEVHWAQEMLDTVFLILTILGGLSLALSAFLIINTMNAIVAQQVWQIGVMKAVGATFGRVVRVYLVISVVYGLLSLLLAVPLGVVAAHLVAAWLLDLFNITVGSWRVIPTAVAIQVVLGAVVPLLAALVPVIGGARISPHRAMSNYGLGSGFGRGWLDRLMGRIRRLPRLVLLSLRNTFRRKGRVALTLLTLTLGGVMFIMVMSVRESFGNTLDVLLGDFGFDVLVVFDRPHRVTRLVDATESMPGVTCAEVWDVQGATLNLDSGENIDGQLWGVPDNSQMFSPRIVDGRALLPDDDLAILLNNRIAVDEGITVGDTVTLTVDGEELMWTVVGTLININNSQHDNFVPFDTLGREIGNANRGAFVMANSERHDIAAHQKLVRDMRAAYTAHRIKPVFFQSAGELREENRNQFDIIIYLMLAMALLAAMVGSIGLMGTMSINVVERGREIGVMRAIGATSAIVARVFVAEGILIGVLSWLLAALLGYPGALAFSNLVGNQLMEIPFDFRYSVGGVVLWLVIVVVLSALASLWPALRATKVSVREALAYE